MVYLALGAFLVGAIVYIYGYRHPNSRSHKQELSSNGTLKPRSNRVPRNTDSSERHKKADTRRSNGLPELSDNEPLSAKLNRSEEGTSESASASSAESTPKTRPQDAESSIPSISLGDILEEDSPKSIAHRQTSRLTDRDLLYTAPQPQSKPQPPPSSTATMPPPPKRSPSSGAKRAPPTSSSMPPPPRPSSTTPRMVPKPTSTLLPPPSAASTLRGPPSRVLSPSSLAPTSSSLPPSSRPSRKVLLAPGHSPLDWAQLVAHPPNPTFLRGASLPPNLVRVPPSMLKHHNGRKGRDAWGVWQGKVYNLTPYLDFHPGGKGELMRGAGKDGPTMLKLFNELHPWVSWEGMLGECLVGIMVSEEEAVAGEGDGGGKMDEMD